MYIYVYVKKKPKGVEGWIVVGPTQTGDSLHALILIVTRDSSSWFGGCASWRRLKINLYVYIHTYVYIFLNRQSQHQSHGLTWLSDSAPLVWRLFLRERHLVWRVIVPLQVWTAETQTKKSTWRTVWKIKNNNILFIRCMIPLVSGQPLRCGMVCLAHELPHSNILCEACVHIPTLKGVWNKKNNKKKQTCTNGTWNLEDAQHGERTQSTASKPTSLNRVLPVNQEWDLKRPCCTYINLPVLYK